MTDAKKPSGQDAMLRKGTWLMPLAATAVAMAAGCTITGLGEGEMSLKGMDEEPVMFSWQSNDGGITGTMTAALPDATYSGHFFQITQQTRSETITPLWSGWSTGWLDWPYWGWGRFGPYDWTQFATRYTGKVVANLGSSDGRRMRCRLHMARPMDGMSGGGDGECQLQGGATIHARF